MGWNYRSRVYNCLPAACECFYRNFPFAVVDGDDDDSVYRVDLRRFLADAELFPPTYQKHTFHQSHTHAHKYKIYPKKCYLMRVQVGHPRRISDMSKHKLTILPNFSWLRRFLARLVCGSAVTGVAGLSNFRVRRGRSSSVRFDVVPISTSFDGDLALRDVYFNRREKSGAALALLSRNFQKSYLMRNAH